MNESPHCSVDVEAGYQVIEWASPESARALADDVAALHDGREVIRAPHLNEPWAQQAAHSKRLITLVRALLAAEVAIEHTVAVIKWPGRPFAVPWHQDGIDKHLELDPARSVSAWLALSDASAEAGCLRVLPGSHREGYRRRRPEVSPGSGRGRAEEIPDLDTRDAVDVPLLAGQALLFDVALIHSSAPNISSAPRVGLNVRYVARGGILRRDPLRPRPTPTRGGW